MFTNHRKQENNLISESRTVVVHYAKWIPITAVVCVAAILVAVTSAWFASDLGESNALTYAPIVTWAAAAIVAILSLYFPIKAISFDQRGLYLGSIAKQIPWQDVEAVFLADVSTKLGWLTRSKSPAICIALSSSSQHRLKNSAARNAQGYDYHYFCNLLEEDGPRACQDIVRAMRD